MVVKIYHLDDDSRAIEKSRKLIDQRDDLIQVGSTTNPIKGVDAVMRYLPEILLLDLDMHPISGWEVMERIDLSVVRVVIITVDKEMGMRSLARGASFFLDKTYGKVEFNASIDKVIGEIRMSSAMAVPVLKEKGYAWFSSGGVSHPVRFYLDDIEAVKADGNDSILFHTYGQTIIDQNLAETEKVLPLTRFMRISKTYIIALDRFHKRGPGGEIELIRVENKEVERLKIGDKYAKRFYDYLDEQFPVK